MFRFIKDYQSSSRETKQFIWTVAILFVMLFATVGYAYFRLDFHRSGSLRSEAGSSEFVDTK